MIEYQDKDFKIDELGSFYSKNNTVFKVFAPESKSLTLVLDGRSYDMERHGFTFEKIVSGDFHLSKYYYINSRNKEFRDPFSYFSDSKYSYVLDTTRFNKKKIEPKEQDNIIIYETSVRDFSCDDNYKGKYKRKLFGLVEPALKLDGKTIGFDYLKELGITYIQLMPILDFDLDGTSYNWGYNPIAFNYVYNGYISEDKNPYANTNELKDVVNKLHEYNIRVTLDVIFNHTYQIYENDLYRMLGSHFFRKRKDGSFARGSFCGNEIKSEDPFVRAYLIEMVKRYIRLYDIDGIRIDQMGICDYETIDLIYKEAKKIKDDFIVYGEGWNMGEVLPKNKRAAIINAKQIKDIGMFNDYYRDTIIGYICENKNNIDDVKNALGGIHDNLAYNQSINYVECHDNYTFFDRLLKKNDANINKCKLALGIVMVSRGIPFIHSGEEFLRTKNLIENSYNSPESFNKIDWSRRVRYDDICLYLKDLIEVRKNNPSFIKKDAKISFLNYKECIIYALDDLRIFINASDSDCHYNDGTNYEVLLDFDGKKHYFNEDILIKSNSLVIAKK